ncbi:MAG: hypothetical protein UE295_05555 [Acutalibacteraceae bacterium]|nr:hypothetical protein [Acutalibacteraceae bacterium]
MKKIVLALVLAVMGVFLVACGGNGQGTYYPDSSEMQENLLKKKYEVDVQKVDEDGCKGTWLKAEKKDEYIEFYWLDEYDDNDLQKIAENLEEDYPDYDRLITMGDDSKFGTLAFCSTEKAMDDSGIVTVEVKVKV